MNSLSARLLLGSALLVLLTLALGAHFSGKAVRDNFSEYSRQEAEQQAYELAIYLEAWLNRSNQITQPGPALEALFAGEVELLNNAPPTDSPVEIQATWRDIEQLQAEHSYASKQQIMAMFMREEAQRIGEMESMNHGDQVDWLAATLYEVQEFLFWQDEDSDEQLESTTKLPERLGWFLDTTIANARILAVDVDGNTIFDSHAQQSGEAISPKLLFSGSPIHNWQDGAEVASIIVAAGEGHYRGVATDFLQQVRSALLQGAAITFAIALLLAWWFAHRLLAPVRALTHASQSLARGETSETLPVLSHDEVGVMSTAFNDMQAALQSQRQKRKQMIADLAHELNTPLSVIRLELAGLQAGMQAPEDCVEHIEGELQVLTRLAADVGLLASADRGELEVDLQPHDLSLTCRQAVSRWHSRALAAGISLSYVGAKELTDIHVDALRISQVLGNLIANAIRHTPDGGKIEVNAQASGQLSGKNAPQPGVMLSVSDSGEGIARAELSRVFERFTRLDSARGRQGGGTGLGLAIVADIVKRHGGKVWAESSPGQGCTIRLTLPEGS